MPLTLRYSQNKLEFHLYFKHASHLKIVDLQFFFLLFSFKAWAEFKGKLLENGNSDPASWKTRLRCALNKSPEFCEVNERSQLDISEPYKVYRLVPLEEQGNFLTINKMTQNKPLTLLIAFFPQACDLIGLQQIFWSKVALFHQ